MMRRHAVWFLALLLACSSSTAPPPAAPTQPPSSAPTDAEPAEQPSEQELRLTYLAHRLEALRESSHVPGMAVAVVKDGDVIFNRGFGVTDRDANTPVTPDTMFMIGSATKAFTATVMGMLVDEGKMAWDDPLSKHLPFKPQVKGDREATFRDALSHRTGFARMTVLILGNLSPDQVYEIANRGVPAEKLGDKWQYNNVMYAAAGDATARVAGTPWTKLVAERIFAPLGMSGATAVLDDAKAAGNLSKGYTWNARTKTYEPEAPRDIGTSSPAGSIVASSTDMTRWVAFQLSGGAVDGKRLISAEQLAQIHEPQMNMPGDDVDYGLGWMIRKHNGARYIEHGGNIDGFGANVGFFPDNGIGYVVLTNTSGNTAQSATGPIVFDALTTEAYKRADEPTEDYGPYLGAYVADFPPFDGKELKIVEQNGRLAVDVPGQTVYELEPPDADGKRFFTVTNQIYVTFAMTDGRARVLEMHQGGLKMEIWRTGTEPDADVDMAIAGRLLGRYKADDGTVFTVLVHRGRLAVDVPGQLKYSLHPPVDGKWKLRAKPEYYVTFANAAIAFHQDAKTIAAKRVGKAPKPVTMAAVNRVRKPDTRKAVFDALGHCVSDLTVTLENVGLTGTAVERWTGAERWRADYDLSPAATLTFAGTRATAWNMSSYDAPKQLAGDDIKLARFTHPMVLFGDWRQFFDTIAVRGTETIDGKTVAKVELRVGELPPAFAWVEVRRGDVLKAQLPSAGGPALEVEYRDYRKVRGARIPFEWEFFDPSEGKTIVRRKKVLSRQPEAPDALPATVPAQP